MKPHLYSVLSFIVLALGCSKSDDNAKTIIEQQRVNLETMKQNQETLENIHQKEKALDERSRKITEAEKSIGAREKRLVEYEKELDEKRIKINKDVESVNTQLAAIKKNEKNILDYSNRVTNRIPYLEELALKTANDLKDYLPEQSELKIVINEIKKSNDYHQPTKRADENSVYLINDMDVIYNENPVAVKNYWFNACKLMLNSSGVINIVSEKDFENSANGYIDRFIKQKYGESLYDEIRFADTRKYNGSERDEYLFKLRLTAADIMTEYCQMLEATRKDRIFVHKDKKQLTAYWRHAFTLYAKDFNANDSDEEFRKEARKRIEMIIKDKFDDSDYKDIMVKINQSFAD